jgi:archaellin
MATIAPAAIILLFCTILVSAAAAMVIQKTMVQTGNRAVQSTTARADSVIGSALRIIDVHGRGTGHRDLDFFYIKIKLLQGSRDEVDLQKLLISLNTGTSIQEYRYEPGIDCTILPYGVYSNASLMNESNNASFGIHYDLQIQGDSHSIGFLTPGDVATLCFKAPVTVGDGQKIIFFLANQGSSKIVLETETPTVFEGQYVAIYNKLI